MDNIVGMAYDEAQRLLETSFSFYNPYICIINAKGVPDGLEDYFYLLVEEELALKGEKIKRTKGLFKILKYQK